MVREDPHLLMFYADHLAGVGKEMDVNLENLKGAVEPNWAHFGRKKNLDTSEKVMELMSSEKYQATTRGNAPLT